MKSMNCLIRLHVSEEPLIQTTSHFTLCSFTSPVIHLESVKQTGWLRNMKKWHIHVLLLLLVGFLSYYSCKVQLKQQQLLLWRVTLKPPPHTFLISEAELCLTMSYIHLWFSLFCLLSCKHYHTISSLQERQSANFHHGPYIYIILYLLPLYNDQLFTTFDYGSRTAINSVDLLQDLTTRHCCLP